MPETPAKPDEKHVLDRPHFSIREVLLFLGAVVGILAPVLGTILVTYLGFDHRLTCIEASSGHVERRLTSIENKLDVARPRAADDDDQQQAGFTPIPKRARQ